MSAKPTVPMMKFAYTGGIAHIEVFLKNDGTSPLGPGVLIIRKATTDGTVEDLSLFNSTTLAPGETTRLSQYIPPPSGFAVVRYKFSLARYKETDGQTFPVEDVYGAVPKGCSPVLLLVILTAAAVAAALAYVA